MRVYTKFVERLAARGGVVADHLPAVVVAGEEVGGVGGEVGGAALDHAGDALDAGNAAELTLDEDVEVADRELHEVGVIEDAGLALADGVPADDGGPTGVDAHGALGVLPDLVHSLDAEFVEGVVEPLVGGPDFFKDFGFVVEHGAPVRAGGRRGWPSIPRRGPWCGAGPGPLTLRRSRPEKGT